jgi:hypothetical protein
METLSGVVRLADQSHQRLPLTGYEADNAMRTMFLSASNQFNLALAKRTGNMLRVGLHPFDLQNHLAEKLICHLQQVTQFCDYSELLQGQAERSTVPA